MPQNKAECSAEVVDIREASKRLGKSINTLKAWIRKGEVPWGHFLSAANGADSGHWVIPRPAFDNWMEGGVPEVHQTIVIDTPEAYEALKHVIITRR